MRFRDDKTAYAVLSAGTPVSVGVAVVVVVEEEDDGDDDNLEGPA